jgi:hypothetical protein
MMVSVNTYVSFKKVSQFPSSAVPLAGGKMNSGKPFVAAVDSGDHPALLVRTWTDQGEELKLRMDFVRLVESLVAAEAAEVDRWEPLRQDMTKPGWWGNNILSVHVSHHGDVVHIEYHRRDRAPIRDWRVGQRLKNQLAGPEYEGIEIYPAESRVVDESNEFHIWCVPWQLPYGFDQESRLTQDQIDSAPGGPGFGAIQRDDPDADTSGFDPHDQLGSPVRVPYRPPQPEEIEDILQDAICQSEESGAGDITHNTKHMREWLAAEGWQLIRTR